MQLSLQTFTSLVQNMAAAVQSASSQLLDLTVGSTLRAVLEANASIALWMQWLVLQVLQCTRAATSTGPDLDSWMADFTLTRLQAAPGTGAVSFSRYTPTFPALIPVGVLVRTADGTQTFKVTVDTQNQAWSAAANGYLVGAGASSQTVPVVAQTAGAAGNVQAGTVTMLASAIPGIDRVANQAPFQNGLDAEPDAAFRARFQNFIQSRSRATVVAVGYAISSVQQGLQYTIQENVDTAGNPRMGSFVVTVDDGTGSPSSSLLSTVQSAVDGVRPVGSVFAIQPPTVVTSSISLTLTVMPNAVKASVSAAVATAIGDYVDALPIGASLPLTKLAQIAYATDPSITNVSQISINGIVADIVPPSAGVVKAGVVSVN